MIPSVRIPNIQLSNGQYIPVLGLGTSKAESKMLELHNAIGYAVKIGYRYIDSAWIYFINSVIRDALNETFIDLDNQLKRSDLFLSCKLWNIHHSKDLVKWGLSDSLANLGVDYLDLYLIGSPMGFKGNCGSFPYPKDSDGKVLYSDVHYLETYHALEESVKIGTIKSIGVSNFNIEQLQKILCNCEIKPVVNLIEIHPYFQNDKLVEFCQNNGIIVIAFSPLADAITESDKEIPNLLKDQTLIRIGNKYNKSPAQISLRWLYQRGIVSIPRALKATHILENAQIFDFALDEQDMNDIKSLNKNLRIHDNHELKDHPYYPFNEDI